MILYLSGNSGVYLCGLAGFGDNKRRYIKLPEMTLYTHKTRPSGMSEASQMCDDKEIM